MADRTTTGLSSQAPKPNAALVYLSSSTRHPLTGTNEDFRLDMSIKLHGIEMYLMRSFSKAQVAASAS